MVISGSNAINFANMDLCKLIKTESLDVIEDLVSRKGFTTGCEWLDYQALNSALKFGRQDVAEFLLQKNCRVNSATKSSVDTPLHNAIHLANPKLISDLLERQACVTVVNADGDSPLHLAFLQNQEKLVDIILDSIEKNSSFSNPKNSQGLTHLHIACTRSNNEVIEGFLAHGALAEDSIGKHSIIWAGYNAFHFAASFKSMTAIRVLLSQGTDESLRARSQQDCQGKTPLQLINQQLKELSIMSSLMTSRGFSHFHMACMGRDSQLLKSFLDNDIDFNRKSLSLEKFCPSYSPLHFATLSTNCENVELLVKRGADTNSQNKDEMTPVQFALYNQKSASNDRIVRILYDEMENKLQQVPDRNGLNFLHVACSMNDLERIGLFLDKGVDVNAEVTYERQRLYHYTPLHFAIKYEHFDAVKYLVERGAEVNCGEDCVDGTPLLLACKVGHKGIIDFLVDKGADVKAVRAHDKKTPLHLLVEYCLEQKFKYVLMLPYVLKLIELGVDLNARDVQGNTVLHLACNEICYGVPCVKLFLKIGADVDVENESGMTAFECQLASFYIDEHVQPGDYTIVYHHVMKLKEIGLKVNEKNEECCKRLLEQRRFDWDPEKLAKDFTDEELARKRQERFDEIEKMKSIKIADEVSLYDFVRMEPQQAKNVSTHETLIEFLQKDFPLYGYLLRLQYRKAVELRKQAAGNRAAAKRRRTK